MKRKKKPTSKNNKITKPNIHDNLKCYKDKRNIYKTSTNEENLSLIDDSFMETRKNSGWSFSSSDDNSIEDINISRTKICRKNYRRGNEGFQCNICKVIYPQVKQIVSHEKIHKQFSTLCYICGISTKSHRKLEMHIKFHKTSTTFEIAERSRNSRRLLPENTPCQICKKQFASYLKLMEHTNTHTKEKPYICPCGSRFGNHSNFIAHFKKYKCPADGRIIPVYAPSFLLDPFNKGQTRRNMKKSNSTSELTDSSNTNIFRSSFCTLCCEDFITNEKLCEHNISVHGIQQYICEICGIKFKTENKLRKHTQSIHEICTYECPKCNLTHKNKTDYENHICDRKFIKCAYCLLEIEVNQYKAHVIKHIYRTNIKRSNDIKLNVVMNSIQIQTI